MSIKQVSVYLENRPGALLEFTSLLANAQIDLIALSIADTTDFGILRAIVNDSEKTLELLQNKGYTAKINHVLAVAVSDTPGGLSSALQVLQTGGVSIEYLYSFVRRVGHKAVIMFRLDKPEEAETLFLQNGLVLLAQEEIIDSCK